jgi:hyperosmotically inducible protein
VKAARRLIPLLLVIASGPALNGCTAAAVAGAGAAGYYIGKDERSVGRIADDAAITTSINAKLAKEDLGSVVDIDVDTYNGVVTLHGKVSSQRQADRVYAIAGSTKGVQRVVSKLVVVP